MQTIAVWLLVMSGTVNSGALGAVQPHLYPTKEDCEVVLRAANMLGGRIPSWGCVKTNVIKP